MRKITRGSAAADAVIQSLAPLAPAPTPPPPALVGQKRGALLIVQPQASYAARREYDFADVCRIGDAIEKEEMNERDLDDVDPATGQLVHGIPRSTMRNKWLKADRDVMGSGVGRLACRIGARSAM